MRRVIVAACCAVISIVFVAVPARADSITVTSGEAFIVDPSGPFRMTLGFDDTTLSIRWTQSFVLPFVVCASGCQPGDVLSFNSTVFHTGPINTEGLDNDAVGGGLAFAGSLSFIAPAVTLPPASDADANGGVTITAPFTFGGTLQAFNAMGRDPILVSTDTYTGQGTATLRMPVSPSGVFSAGPLRYDFSAEAPTPEPPTVLLLAGGLAVMFLRRRRPAHS